MEKAAFLDKWLGKEGGAERPNFQMFLTELCLALGLSTPDPASASTDDNDYVFERAVRSSLDPRCMPQRIDLYKKGCLLLEAKQSRWPEQPLVIEAAVRAARRPISPADLSRTFHGGGRRIEPRIARLLGTLHRYGHLRRLPDERYVPGAALQIGQGCA